jgi:hypothetical protein
MIYHRFPDLRNLFQADLNKKLTANLVSRDFVNESCNRIKNKKVYGKCIFNSECRNRVVVYKVTCQVCKMQYVGNTQQHVKDRMKQHFQQVVKSVLTGVGSDTFARHFASHID